VLIKLGFTLVGLVLLFLAGRRLIDMPMQVDLVSFTAAVLLSTLSIVSLGFLIASVVPTARFAQPLSAAILYPMVGLSGIFFPLEILPRPLELVALSLPMTHAVALLQGIWDGTGWRPGSTAALVLIFGVCTAVSTRVFRWE
jgi:ABC-2 type transport system permease protein